VRDDVGHKEINLGGAEWDGFAARATVGGVDAIATAIAGSGGRSHLHSPEVMASVEDEIVGLGVAIRLSDGESEVSRLVHEGQFGNLSTTFWVREFSFFRRCRRVVFECVGHSKYAGMCPRSFSICVGLRTKKKARAERLAPEFFYPNFRLAFSLGVLDTNGRFIS